MSLAEGDEEIRVKIKKIVCDFLNRDEIRLSDPLLEMGMDSISFIKLIITLENQCGVVFAKEDLLFERFETCNDLIEYIASKVGESS